MGKNKKGAGRWDPPFGSLKSNMKQSNIEIWAIQPVKQEGND